MATYRRRSVDSLIAELLAEVPAVSLVGPRASGKTTTAIRHAAVVARLDREAEAVAFRADPDAALRKLGRPTLLDEWQAVPEVLGAVKRAVDTDSRPGQFLLTGSVRADLDSPTWPGTGRVVRVAMYPLTVAEQLKRSTPPLVDRLARGEPLEPGPEPIDLYGYVELAMRGGFPEAALSLSERSRRHWLDSYVDQLVTRDASAIAGGREPGRLRRFLDAYVINSAGVVSDKTLYDAAGINRKTALAYERLLEGLLIVESLPSWSSNRLKRLVKTPKRYLIDASLLGGCLGVDTAAVFRDGDLLGRVLDTFVVAQLRAESAVAETRPRLYHLRQEQGRREVDLIVELAGRRVVGVEIKATSAPSPKDARHLEWLRDTIGERFVAGVVLHTGPQTMSLGEKLTAAPISTLWA